MLSENLEVTLYAYFGNSQIVAQLLNQFWWDACHVFPVELKNTWDGQGRHFFSPWTHLNSYFEWFLKFESLCRTSGPKLYLFLISDTAKRKFILGARKYFLHCDVLLSPGRVALKSCRQWLSQWNQNKAKGAAVTSGLAGSSSKEAAMHWHRDTHQVRRPASYFLASLFKVWSVNQQHLHPLGAGEKGRISVPHPHPRPMESACAWEQEAWLVLMHINSEKLRSHQPCLEPTTLMGVWPVFQMRNLA